MHYVKRKNVFWLLFFAIFWGVAPAYSQERAIEEVKIIANNFLKVVDDSSANRTDIHSKSQIQLMPIKRGNTTYMYVVNTEEDGWVIVSNEKQYHTIIGYSKSSKFDNDTTEMPGALKLLLTHHMNMIDSLRQDGYDLFYSRTSSRHRNPVTYNIGDTLLYKNGGYNCWKQIKNNSTDSIDCSRVYNKFCPDFYSCHCGRTYAGCSAIAMAQIMWYWQWPDYAIIKEGIYSSGITYGSSSKHYYDWKNMPASITNSTPIYQADMVAGLIRDCGYAAGMIYMGCDQGSLAGIDNVISGLTNKFKYHCNRVHEYAWTDMEPIIKSELDKRRPVLCQAWESATSAHSFVIDGYNSSSYYHINWGKGIGMWDWYNMGFEGYDSNRTYITELYPDCTQKDDDVLGLNIYEINSGDDITSYSTNDIYVNYNNSSLVVNSGGHLNVTAGNKIVLSPGFIAERGSDVVLSIRDFCENEGAHIRKMSKSINNKTTKSHLEFNVQPNPAITNIKVICSKVLNIIIIYSLSGQPVLQTVDMEINVSSLPAGMYIVRALTTTGEQLQSKFIKQ